MIKLIPIWLAIVLLNVSAVYGEEKLDYASIPFDSSATTLPIDFRGNNQKELFEKIIITIKKNKKDEFETTEQWKQRVDSNLSQNIYGNININSLLSFVKDNSNATYDYNFIYDADNKLINLDFSVYNWNIDINNDNLERYSIDLDEISSSTSSYVGENAYGAKTNAIEITSNRIRLILNNYNEYLPLLMTNKYSPKMKIVINNIDATKAKSLKNTISLLFVVKLVSPYAAVTEKYFQATRNSPRGGTFINSNLITSISEIWVYDRKTGEVFKKIDTNKTKDETPKSESWFRKLF